MMKKELKYLKLEKYPNGWAFNDPPQWEFLDYKLEKALDAERDEDFEKAQEIYLEIIDSCPEYLPALNNLGLLFKQDGDLDAAIATLDDAVTIGLACLPEEFEPGKDLIPWHYEDNRPFLLAYENLGVCYLEKALEAFEHILELNPGYRGIAKKVEELRKSCGYPPLPKKDEEG